MAEGSVKAMMDQLGSDFTKRENELALKSLQRYLPGVTAQNIGQYAGRVTVVHGNSTEPKRYYLDYRTPDEKLVLIVHPIETHIDGDTVSFTLKTSIDDETKA